ncbi:MAG: hypothetical protein KA149_05935, partial [Chitinophagales bacterium]|nr:hypothetical protein [Chitinophagales bacterium]
MRKNILILLSLFIVNSICGQDILKLKNGEELKVIIVQVGEPKIEYKLHFLPDGPSAFTDKKDVSYIEYADGSRKSFDSPTSVPVSNTSTNVAAAVGAGSSASNAELTKNLNQLASQFAAYQKSQEAQNRSMMELLNTLNNNVTLLKSSVDKRNIAPATATYVQETAAPKSPTSVNTNTTAYNAELQRSNNNTPTSNSSDLPVPKLDNIPYQLKSNGLSFLDRVEGSFDIKAKGLYGGTEQNIKIFGQRSNLRFGASSVPRIFIRFETNVDPSEKLWLLKGTIVKNDRRFLCSSMSLTGASRDVSGSRISIEFKEMGNNFYEIIFPNLAAGEYCFTAPMAGTGGVAALLGGGGG